MGASVCIDGALVAPELASVPVMDRGFLYGDSAFEVTRTYGGQPFALGAHLDRLERSCERLGIPATGLGAALRPEIAVALGAAANEESYVRVIVTRGITDIGLGVGRGETPRRVVVVLPLTEQPAALYEDGVELATVMSARALDGTGAAGAKASNYLPNILALAAARARGGYEALSVGPGGELLEGATSNVFLVRGGRVATPPLGVGILEGITRRVVMEAAREGGVEVEERLLFPPDLYGADEAFITSSLREVVPVVRADGAVIGDGRPGLVTRRLAAAFARRRDALLAAERG
ncbi:MAG: aminotransferase class IV [Sandaracinaceae bacterium]|nr:aminotransferase class IV [Sandaracinaceae bacterium]